MTDGEAASSAEWAILSPRGMLATKVATGLHETQRNVMKACFSILMLLTPTLVGACGDALQRQAPTRELITARTVGLAHLEENKLEDAKAEFTRLTKLAPREALGYANLGLVHLLLGEHDQAERHAKRALTIAPDDPDIRLLLSQVYRETERAAQAREELEASLERTPGHIRSLYGLVELAAASDDDALRQRGTVYLAQLVELIPANLAVRLQLIEALVRAGDAERAAGHLEAMRQQAPELPSNVLPFYNEALRLTRAGRAEDAIPPATRLHDLLKPTITYVAGVPDLLWLGFARVGFTTFSENVLQQPEAASEMLGAIRFTDVTSSTGLDAVRPLGDRGAQMPALGHTLAVGDYDGDGDPDLYLGRSTGDDAQTAGVLFRNDQGHFAPTSSKAGLVGPDNATAAAFADYDNDGWLDLYVAAAGPDHLYRNLGDGRFRDVAATVGVAASAQGHVPLFADVDHDGDLDLYVASPARNRLYRNNVDGPFDQVADAVGVAGNNLPSRDVAFGDFDRDGDIDLFVINERGGNILYLNLRESKFRDATSEAGLGADSGGAAVATADYDNDGSLDLFVTGSERGHHRAYRNVGDGSFERDARSGPMIQALSDFRGLDALFLDFDNDGFRDLVVAGQPATSNGRAVFLFRNTGAGEFRDASSILPNNFAAVRQIAAVDYDQDGDMDLLVEEVDGKVRLLRNEGGNVNHYLKVHLVGLRSGSGKNNHFGIGARVEVRAGEHYQAQVVTDPMTHFGLGSRRTPDAVRIIWTNGVPQNVVRPEGDRALVEKQILKGSCAFIYTWNGRHYEFLTDIMWRSAIGMPLGIMGGSTAYASPEASREYVLIRGESLKTRDSVYSLQLTEELWETAYVDELKLILVDHPESIDVYVDERFVPPGPPSSRLFAVGQEHLPVAASDGQGNDVLELISKKDDLYISNMNPAAYQGITSLHDLILDLGDLPDTASVTLFLNGWIFPTDASINVAMSQRVNLEPIMPYLQVVDAQGTWVTGVEDLSFPAGKNKTVVAELTDLFQSEDHRVRIRTNLEVYWDYIFFTTSSFQGEVRQTTLNPSSADLHHRGFSREYRKGGRYGPHWFEYGDVSTDSRWLPIEGLYTRFGDVLPLLSEPDDQYIIMGPGDEATVEFAVPALPVPSGWRRDFLLYSTGWIKDADLNTAAGNTVTPLPFHGMSRYPYGGDESYPADSEHQRYLEVYNTRSVTLRDH